MTGTKTGSRSDSLGSGTTETDASVKDRAKSAVGSAAGTVKDGGGELTHAASERVGEVAHKVADKADDRKSELAQQARTLQEKAAEFATSIREEQPQVGRALEQVTNKADGLVTWIESTPVEDMAHELSDQMRKRPMLFAAGMFGVGFALSRVLKPVDASRTTGTRQLTTGSTATTQRTGTATPAYNAQLPAASPVQGGMH